MLVVVPFCRKDRPLAERQAEWIAELGPYPAHQLLSVRDAKAAPIDYSSAGFGEVKNIVAQDAPDSWPEGPNTMMARAGKQIEHVQKVPWLWCEADTVPMRAGWLDEIEAEYTKALKAGKVFLGDLQRPLPGKPHFVPHSSGLCVYPAALTQHAGEAYMAGNVPFDSVAGPSVVPKLMQSELLYHLWKAPPFESWADVERRIFAVRPKCAVYHSDKSGSLLGLLRERKNFSESAALQADHRPEKPLCLKVDASPDAGTDTDACLTDAASGSSAPPAENNLPVPVLAEPEHSERNVANPCAHGNDESEARASTIPDSAEGSLKGEMALDARGGQFISEPDSAAELPLLIAKVQLWVEYDASQQKIITIWEWDREKWVKTSWPSATDNYDLKFSIAHKEARQIPWASKADSIAEIRRLAERLMQFSDSSPHVRLVRAELHDAGVIRLSYRFKKRRGWKRKK